MLSQPSNRPSVGEALRCWETHSNALWPSSAEVVLSVGERVDNWLEHIRKKLVGWERHSGFCENDITLVRIPSTAQSVSRL
jgi:hypothetical protein